MSSINNYYIFGILFFFYICIQLAAWAEINDKTEYYIKIPNILSKILFPFKKNTRVRMVFCVISGYIEISGIVILILALLKIIDLDGKDIIDLWSVFFLSVISITGIIELKKIIIYEGKDGNLLYKLLSWMGYVIFFIIAVGWIAFTIYYLVNYFKY